MKNKNIFGIVSLAVAALMIGSFVSAMDYSNEQSEKIQKAIEDNDYEGWKSSIIDILTEENFNKLVEEKRNQDEFDALTEKFIDAWEEGDEDRILQIREKLEELSRKIYGDDVNFAAGKNSFSVSISDGGYGVYTPNTPEGMKVESTYSAVHTSGSNPCKVGEECETESIEIYADFADEGLGLEEATGVIVVKDRSDSRSFWEAFRFW